MLFSFNFFTLQLQLQCLMIKKIVQKSTRGQSNQRTEKLSAILNSIKENICLALIQNHCDDCLVGQTSSDPQDQQLLKLD